MFEAIIVTIIAIILGIEQQPIGQFMFAQPLVAGTIVGIALGDVSTAIEVSIPLQLIFMGAMGIGASIPPDATLGTIIAVALAAEGIAVETAIALAVPVAFVAVSLNTFIRMINTFTMHRIDKLAEDKNYKMIEILHLTVFPLLIVIRSLIVVYPAVYYGAEAVQGILDVIPAFVLTGFNVSGQMLPALGFGMILNMIGIPHLLPFLFIGFVLASYLPITLIGVSVIGVCSALIYDYFNSRTGSGGSGGGDLASLMEE
jgi:mannose/fructose/N-acetylgalactosamine-specific phosphotransferase system component IIC